MYCRAASLPYCRRYKVLAAYAKLYFAEKPEDVPQEVYIAP